MSIIITGHKGYIGSRLQRALAERDIFSYGIDKRVSADINFMRNPTDCADVIFHLAAQSGVVPSWDNPYQDAMDNIMATIRICKIFPSAKIIFTTSGAAVDPESPYGLSKRTAEEYIKMLHDNYVILRLSSVYGEKDRGVVDTFIRGDKCTVYGDGSATRDFVHVDDVVEGLIQAYEWPVGEYTLGSGIGTSVKELAVVTGKEIEYKPARKGEKQNVVLENTTPSWKPSINVLDYVRHRCSTDNDKA